MNLHKFWKIFREINVFFFKSKLNTHRVCMCFSKITVQHSSHHFTSRYQHCTMRPHPSVIQLECNVAKHAVVNTAFFQILLHALEFKICNLNSEEVLERQRLTAV